MYPITIRFRYKFADAINQVWESLTRRPYRLTISLLVNLLSLMLMLFFIKSSDQDLIPLIALSVNGLYLCKIIFIACILPILYFIKLKKYGEIVIEHTESGITYNLLNQSDHNIWSNYDGIDVYKYSYRINKKNYRPSLKIPIRTFKDRDNFHAFVNWVRNEL